MSTLAEKDVRELDDGGAEINADTASGLNRGQQIADTAPDLQHTQPGRHHKLEVFLEQGVVMTVAFAGT
jgi:hypothetical protein